jgi:2-haloacid dehalogenase
VILVQIEVVAFDVFGTLVDWRTSIAAALAEAGRDAGLQADWPAVADAWRGRYKPAVTAVARGERPFEPLDVLHAQMLDEVIAEFRLQALRPEQRTALVRAWHRLAPWPDSGPGLSRLGQRYLLTPLSNGGMGLLTRLAKAAGLPFDCIVSAELARSYKPDPRVYALVPDFFSVSPGQVLMVAAHPDDLLAAARCGLRTAFVPRPREWGPGASAPPAAPDTDFVAGDLIELASLLSRGT